MEENFATPKHLFPHRSSWNPSESYQTWSYRLSLTRIIGSQKASYRGCNDLRWLFFRWGYYPLPLPQMKILSLNYRGLGIPEAVQELRCLVSEEAPKILFLSEWIPFLVFYVMRKLRLVLICSWSVPLPKPFGCNLHTWGIIGFLLT